MKVFVVGRGAFAAALLLALVSALPAAARAAEIAVRIDNFVFTPQKLTVKVGDTVIWRVKDSATYNKNNYFDVEFVPDSGRIQLNPFQGYDMDALLPGVSTSQTTPDTGVLAVENNDIDVRGTYAYSLKGRSNGKVLDALSLIVA